MRAVFSLAFLLILAPLISHASQDLEPFTGKITRNKVRMRLQPSLDAPILSEFSRDDLISVVGESDEFYVITPPKGIRAYIFRTFVLDGTVEGNRVNVRLEPALESPVIAQLNSGDHIEGVISPLSSKWLEIAPPASTRFYVCKEYVEKIGTASMIQQIEKRRSEVSALLLSAQQNSEIELQKNFQEIQLDSVLADLKVIIKQYIDFPKSVEKAQSLLNSIQDTYLQKKLAFLEAKAFSVVTQSPLKENIESTAQPQQFMAMADGPVLQQKSFLPSWEAPFDSDKMSGKMATWIPIEKALYETWRWQNSEGTPQEFYERQFSEAVKLKGVVQSSSRQIKNKPGDYLLVGATTTLPIAYLYSTRVDLQGSVGREMTLYGIRRPNNHFAFPAYFVISVE